MNARLRTPPMAERRAAMYAAGYWRNDTIFSLTRQHAEAARVLGAVAHAFTINPKARASATAANPDAKRAASAGRFEREVFTYWAQAVELLDHPDEAGSSAVVEVYRLAVRRGAWRATMQRPLEHYDPTLTRKPFWTSAELPAARALEAAFPQILAELKALVGQGPVNTTFAKYHSRVVAAGGWSDVQLFAGWCALPVPRA